MFTNYTYTEYLFKHFYHGSWKKSWKYANSVRMTQYMWKRVQYRSAGVITLFLKSKYFPVSNAWHQEVDISDLNN